MSLLVKKPSIELEGYIYRYTSMNFSKFNAANSFPHGSFRLPNSIIRLAFHFSEIIPWIEIKDRIESQPKHHVRGYQTSPIIFNTKSRLDVFSIELTPFGFREIFGISCSELMVTPFSLELIVGKDYEMLIEKLPQIGSFNDRVNFMNSYFISKISFDKQIKRAYFLQKCILNLNTIPSVKQLANENFITERTMRRFFNVHFGIPPKKYLKLSRFEKAIKAFSQESNTNLFQTALDFGYYDQSHFTNDFKLFMGMTPTEFQKNILETGINVN